ncbi:MAG: peptidoglycan editing factor PgeF [Rhodospirillales bacterium]
MISASVLQPFENIRHGFFTRQGGASAGVFDSLNCGFGSGDAPAAVKANRARVMEDLALPETALVTGYQAHSADVAVVEDVWRPDEAPRVDGMVTNVPGIALGILTADCAPVLFVESEAGVVAAAHAGWRGAKDGVLDATVEAMAALGARAENITAAIGPCIQQASYEVSEPFREAFIEDDAGNRAFFAAGGKAGHCQFDLPGYVRHRLNECSVGRIESLGLDTYADAARFYSYRRATHRGEKQYGRLVSVIALGK